MFIPLLHPLGIQAGKHSGVILTSGERGEREIEMKRERKGREIEMRRERGERRDNYEMGERKKEREGSGREDRKER